MVPIRRLQIKYSQKRIIESKYLVVCEGIEYYIVYYYLNIQCKRTFAENLNLSQVHLVRTHVIFASCCVLLNCFDSRLFTVRMISELCCLFFIRNIYLRILRILRILNNNNNKIGRQCKTIVIIISKQINSLFLTCACLRKNIYLYYILNKILYNLYYCIRTRSYKT